MGAAAPARPARPAPAAPPTGRAWAEHGLYVSYAPGDSNDVGPQTSEAGLTIPPSVLVRADEVIQ
jgi:hypothetical protein